MQVTIMNDKNLIKILSPTRRKRRKKMEQKHDVETFTPCVFALEQFLKRHKRIVMGRYSWKVISGKAPKKQEQSSCNSLHSP
ncbi:hypothetical protein EGX60_01135 [Escherichia coli]|nr:hypothetical protein [Escherichia coli]EFN7679803.1 hypothetical protein [Escherichia coli]EFN7684909.1 hypothetical protein [Escherichia coli]EFO0448508.1 hypothetical protein [Escherichia coli]